MVMSEVNLCRIEEFLLGPADELRPALAERDPAVLSLAEGHVSLCSMRHRGVRETERRVADGPAAPGDRGSEPSQHRVGDTFPQRCRTLSP
jgi:hypothetical protein